MLSCNELAQAWSRFCTHRPQPMLAGTAGEHRCSQEPAVLLRCVCSHRAGKKKLTVKLGPADFLVSCSGKSLLLLRSNPLIFSKNEVERNGTPAAVKWILAQTLLTEILQALAVLHLDLWSISGNTSIINELLLILPPRVIFGRYLRDRDAHFLIFQGYQASQFSSMKERYLLQALNTHTCPPQEARADLTAICFVTVAGTSWEKFLASYSARQYTGCSPKEARGKSSFHKENIPIHTYIITWETVLHGLS